MTVALRGAVLLSCIVFAACSGHVTARMTDRSASAVPVSTVSARQIAFSTPLELSGSIAAQRLAVVGAVAAGRVVAMNVRSGDSVVAGQTIARIDDAAYRAAYAQAIGSAGTAVANINEAKAQADAARTRLRLAEVTAKRMSTLYREGAISAQQNDEAQASLASSRAGVLQARAAIGAALGSRREADAAVSAAAVPLGESVVRAPFDGVVLSRVVEPGAVVGAGSPIATIQDNSRLELDVAVPEEAASTVHNGQTVPVNVDALGNRVLSGRVRAVISSEDPALRSELVKIDLPRAPGLFAGMFARVRFAGRSHSATAVPMSALVNRAGQDGIFAVRSGRAQFVPVQTGATRGGWVEVGNLPATARDVIVKGMQKLTDGATVAIDP
jgi:membrane fusion protein (multidrug efflux system)